MSKMTFTSEDDITKVTVETSGSYLPDVMEVFLGFLRASGYEYIEEVSYKTRADIEKEEKWDVFIEPSEEEEESHE